LTDNREKINIVIPAAGRGSRFSDGSWKKPKPFIDVNGRPMLESVIENISPAESHTYLLLNDKHMRENIDGILSLDALTQEIIEVSGVTEGTACTVLLAHERINNSTPLMIANSDQIVDFDINDYIDDCFNRELDGSILVFKDRFKDPKWSFARVDAAGLVVEVAEKKAISDLATVGIYLFSDGSKFIDAAQKMISANDRVNNEFYTCPVYNYMIKQGARIGVYEIEAKSMHGIGTPEDLNAYLKLINSRPSEDRPD